MNEWHNGYSCIEKARAPRKSSQTHLTGYGARGIHGNGVRAFPRFMIEHLTGNDDLIRAGLFDERAQAALDRILPADGRSPQHLVQHRLRSQSQPETGRAACRERVVNTV